MKEQMLEMLINDEGYRSKLYKDTRGFNTIGIGYNIDEGMPLELAKLIAGWFIDKAITDLQANLPFWSKLNEARQMVLINMVFQLGMPRFLGFRNMIADLGAQDYSKAANDMLDSLWAKQTPLRAHRLSKIMASGVYG